MSNPFDLAKKAPIHKYISSDSHSNSHNITYNQPTQMRTYTKPKSDKLIGYSEVSRDRWSSLSIGTHMRYVRKTGEFRPGGFIKTHTSNSEGHQIIVLENDKFNKEPPRYKQFPVVLDELASIYIKDTNRTVNSKPRHPQNEEYEDKHEIDTMANQAVTNLFKSEIGRLEKRISSQDAVINELRLSVGNMAELLALRNKKK